MKLTRHNGSPGKNGAYNPKHNDRSFNINNSEHIDEEQAKRDVAGIASMDIVLFMMRCYVHTTWFSYVLLRLTYYPVNLLAAPKTCSFPNILSAMKYSTFYSKYICI